MRIMYSTHFFPVVLQLAAFLRVVPIIFAEPSQLLPMSLSSLGPRDIVLPLGWGFLGCVTDDPEDPTLTSWGATSADQMTVEACVNFCITHYLNFAGLQAGTDCHCGNVTSQIAIDAPPTDCDMPCSGDPTQMCGAPLRQNLYWSNVPIPPGYGPTLVDISVSGPWNLLACYNDSSAQRILQYQTDVAGGPFNNSVESCTEACYAQRYVVAGMGAATQCYCGLIRYPSFAMPPGDCKFACPGNQSEFCGGIDRASVYFYTGIL